MSGFSPTPSVNSTAAPVAITPTGSPFTFANPVAGPIQVIISGGTVTAINIVVSSVDYLVGVVAGSFTVCAGASISDARCRADDMASFLYMSRPICIDIPRHLYISH
jgi:hypothetical protein